jgi:peptidyl-prolyl cis-trans isomerase A (cyclophilin A)
VYDAAVVSPTHHPDEERIMTVRSSLAVLFAAALAGTAVLAQAPKAGQPTSTGNLKSPATLKETAPATFKARFDTSAGAFVVTVQREWAPHGADRFYNLVKNGFFDDTRFFRVISGFMVQFGIHGDPAVSAAWRSANLPADPVKQSNKRGFITYAMAGAPTTRTTQVFINFQDNSGLDKQGFAPFGEVTTGMSVVDKIFSGYGEGAPSGRGPEQGRIQAEGNAYLTKAFPKMDYVKKATIE